LKARLYEKPWIVDVRDPVNNPEHVLEYLARYTHRVAIANSRIRVLKDGMVTFTLRIERKSGRKRSRLRLWSSSVGSCFTACPSALCASGITGFWPIGIVQRILPLSGD
jgi:hypothetical protein